MVHKIKRSFFKLKKWFYRKDFVGMVYEKESYNTCVPPIIIQTYIVIKKNGKLQYKKYRKIITRMPYYDIANILESRGYKEIGKYL